MAPSPPSLNRVARVGLTAATYAAIGYPAFFQASTPPFSALAFVNPWAWYLAA